MDRTEAGDRPARPLRCSIIICTYNRAALLERLLIGLNHLDYDHFEVVVVNGPSTDWTDDLLEEYSGRIKVVVNTERNLSRSRNIGIAAASGDILIFIDDDAIPCDSRWLNKIVEVFEKDREGRVGAAGGGSLHRHTNHFEFDGGYTTDYCEQIFHKEKLGDMREDGIRVMRRTSGNNGAFRRSALQEIGGWDENFIYYADEVDVCLRLARKGYSTVYIEDAPVRHFPAPAHYGAPLIRNRRLITRSDTYFSLKNGYDNPIVRFFKTLAKAPGKHFFVEFFRFRREGKITRGTLAGFVLQWLAGLFQGLALGIFSRRKTGLPSNPPPEFLPYPKIRAEKKLCVCVISRQLPDDPGAGGIARHSLDIAHGLHEIGHEVHIICQSNMPIRFANLGLTIHGIPAVDIPTLQIGGTTISDILGYATAVYAKIVRLAAEGFSFDIVESHSWNLEGLFIAREKPCPLAMRIATPHTTVFKMESFDDREDQTCINYLENWLAENASAVYSSSASHLEYLEKTMGLKTEAIRKLAIVPLGLKHRRTSGQFAFRKTGNKRLLYVGRIEKRKGAEVLLDVLPELLGEFHDWECHIAGNYQTPTGWEIISAFNDRNREKNWHSRVHFHGEVPEERLFRFYRDCDLFVAPSLYESFGLIYLEAMQYGKAVVGTDVGSIPNVIANGVSGLLAKPANREELLEALRKLCGDEELREQMGRQGLADFRQRFSHTVMAANMAADYEIAIGEWQKENGLTSEGAKKLAAQLGLDSHREQPRRRANNIFLGLAAGVYREIEEKLGTSFSALRMHESFSASYLKNPREAVRSLVSLIISQKPRAGNLEYGLFYALEAKAVDAVFDICLIAIKDLPETSRPRFKFHVAFEGAMRLDADLRAKANDIHAEHLETMDANQMLVFLQAKDLLSAGFSWIVLPVFEALASGRIPLKDRQHMIEAHYHAGSILKADGKPEEACGYFEKIIGPLRGDVRHSSILAGSHFHLGEICLAEGDSGDAKRHFKATLDGMPQHRRAKDHLDAL